MPGPEMEAITIEIEDGTGFMILDRPDKLNAMNPAMFAELGTAADYLRDEPQVKVIVITGRGRAFCSGIDTSSLAEFQSLDPHRFRVIVRTIQRNFRAFELIEKPVIAMVNGHALGAGTELCLASDMIMASTNATFGLLEVNLGLVVDLGGTQRLPRFVGLHRAKELILTGKRIDAAEAERIGLINSLHEPDELRPAVLELANHLKSLSPVAVGLCKIALDRSGDSSVESGLEYEAQSQSLAFAYLMEKMRNAGE
ncbi:MAG: enoyl-CoA hydratase/isomerase family protein [Actinobacteria bacterium]|nr:enoyl-CoA hydratase/isomerase family protein [Actinomycetota bacterium]